MMGFNYRVSNFQFQMEGKKEGDTRLRERERERERETRRRRRRRVKKNDDDDDDDDDDDVFFCARSVRIVVDDRDEKSDAKTHLLSLSIPAFDMRKRRLFNAFFFPKNKKKGDTDDDDDDATRGGSRRAAKDQHHHRRHRPAHGPGESNADRDAVAGGAGRGVLSERCERKTTTRGNDGPFFFFRDDVRF
jgi:hypothetical protein